MEREVDSDSKILFHPFDSGYGYTNPNELIIVFLEKMKRAHKNIGVKNKSKPFL
jgi:hypothetical protein